MWAAVIISIILLSFSIIFSIQTGSLVIFLALIMVFMSLVLFYFRPEIGAALYIFLSITIFNLAALPSIKIPGGRLYINDLLLVYLLIITFLRKRNLKWTKSPLTLPLFVFWLVRIISAFYNASINNNIKDFFLQLGRAELPLLTFFVFLSIMQKNNLRRALFRYFLMGGFSMLVFYLYSAATRNQELLSSNLLWLRPDVNVTTAEMPRVVALGMLIAYPLFFITLALVLSNASIKIRLGSLLLFAISAAAIVIHGFRGYLYATIISTPVLVLLSQVGKQRMTRKLLLRLSILAGLMFFIVIFLQNFLKLDSNSYLLDRTLKPFSSWNADFSFTGRLEEVQWSWPLILSRPLLGWGMNFPINPVLLRLGWEWSFIHIGYFSLLMSYGFLGFMAFVWLILSYLRYAKHKVGETHEVFTRALIVGFMSHTIQMLIVGFTNPGFAEASGIILLNFGFALTVSVGKRYEGKLTKSNI